jgi:LacI family gluconate utilization system Gnt-I transcriptional repressor
MFLGDSVGLKGGDRTIRVEDVAREAGVSPITVSRALRTPELVKAETRQRVTDAVAKTGYVVNSIASSLRSGQSAFISVFVASLENPHYTAAVQGMIDVFEGSRFRLTFSQAGYAEDLSAGQIRAMLPFRPAAIVFSGIVRDEGARQYLKSLDVPVMEMWGEIPEPIDMLVVSPGREGGRLLGEHIAEQGCNRVAYVGHANSRARPRIEGVRQALAAHGKSLALLLPIEGTTDIEDGIAAVDRVLAELPDCDALIFGTDVMAVGALLRLEQLQMAVPARIAVAGYGDLFFAAHTRPSMTTIHTDPHEVGRNVGRILLERLTTGHVAQPVIHVPLHIEVRASTRRR